MYMNRNRTRRLIVCAMLLCLLLTGCGLGGTSAAQPSATPAQESAVPSPTGTPVTQITPAPTATPSPTPSAEPLSIVYQGGKVNSVTVKVGAEFDLSVSLPEGESGTATFASSDEKVASCDGKGHVKALAEGTAEITATAGESSAVCKVTVTAADKVTVTICFWSKQVTDFTLNAASSETIQLNAVLSPAGTTTPVVWSVNDSSIATVSDKGLVTGISEGSTKVVCTCGDSKAECWVRVKGTRPAQVLATDNPSDTTARVVIVYSGYVSTDFTIAVGESIDMNYKLYNIDASQAVTWSIKDNSVATVDQNGLVTGVKKGTTELTCTCGSLSATCIVRVSK